MEVTTTPSDGPARRAGAIAGAVTAGWFFILSGLLGATPGRPVGPRIDAFFQSDAGGWVADAATGSHDRGVSAHPILHYVWIYPIYWLSQGLAPAVPPDRTALNACRAYVALAAGLGIGALIAALVRWGVPAGVVAAVGPVFLLGTGQTMAAVPDHFGISVGLLAGAFGVYLRGRDGPFRRAAVALAGLTLAAGGVTLTNALFPAGLLAVLAARRYGVRVRGWWVAAGAVVGTAVLVGAVYAGKTIGDGYAVPFAWRIKSFATLRLIEHPGSAAVHAVRGVIDSAVGPTPAVDTNNYYRYPMLTYEPTTAPYRVWPYDLAQSVGAAAWLGLLIAGTARALRDPDARGPAAALWGWVGWNAVFHNLWGDEYFLYTPHYAWALVTVVVLGLRGVPPRRLLLLTVPVAAAAAYTLYRIRAVVDTIPA